MTNVKHDLMRLIGVIICCFILIATMNTAIAANANVQKTQQILIDLGYQPGTADGLFGSKTRKALMKYQEDNNLPTSGHIDKATAKALGVKIVSSADKPEKQPADGNIVYMIEYMLRTFPGDYWTAKEKRTGGKITIEGGFDIYLGEDAIDEEGKSGLFLKNYKFTVSKTTYNFVKGHIVLLNREGKVKFLPGIECVTDDKIYTYDGTDWFEIDR